ncbi:CD63 antigen isoform X2 [Lepeophtheirus salmonis]|nr:CD63 antigen-like [Lepeophtheirus salmonis]
MEFQLYKYIEFSNDFFSLVRIVVMGLGIIIIILATLACCFTAKGIVPLLYIYSSLLMVIFCIQVLVFVIGYVYRDKISSGFYDGLDRGLDNYGKDTGLTQAIDGIQTTLHCCGLSNHSDWSNTPWGTGHRGKLPHSCCLYTEEAVCASDRDTAFVHRQGCYRIVVNFFMDNLSKVGIGILCIAGFHLLGVLLSCCLAKTIHQAQYEEIR